jgi:hypothetical protein
MIKKAQSGLIYGLREGCHLEKLSTNNLSNLRKCRNYLDYVIINVLPASLSLLS